MCCDFNIIRPSFEGDAAFFAVKMGLIRRHALCIVVG